MSATVKDVMTRKPIVCKVPSSVEDVVKLLVKNNITGMPVVDSSGKYVGIITRRDIFKNHEETQTAMVMRSPVPEKESDSLSKAAKDMVSQEKRHLAVVNDDNKVVGILTPQDLLKHAAELFGNKKLSEIALEKAALAWEKTPLKVLFNMLTISSIYVYIAIDDEGSMSGLLTDRNILDKIELRRDMIASQIGMDEDEDPWSWSGLRNFVQYAVLKNMVSIPDLTVSDVMVREPKVAYKSAKLSEAIKIMLEGNFNQVPVVDGDHRPYGMLYDLSIMRLFE